MDRHLGRYSIAVSTVMSVDTPCKTEDPTIVDLRDCRRGFHFRAIFHIANVMPLADHCSISRLAVQFQSGLFGDFGDTVEVTLAGSCQAGDAISHYCKIYARCSSLTKITILFMICLNCFCLATT